MPLIASKSKGRKADALLADAADRLLSATKKKMLRDNGRIDYVKLEREGFSSEMIERLKAL